MRAWPLGQEVAWRYLQFNVDVLGGKSFSFPNKICTQETVKISRATGGNTDGREQASPCVPVRNMIGFDSVRPKGLSCSKADMLPNTVQLVSQCGFVGPFLWPRSSPHFLRDTFPFPPLRCSLPFSSCYILSFFWLISLVFPFGLNEE